MANWYWYNQKPGAIGDGLFGSFNFNAANDASGAWGTPGVGDTAFFDDTFASGDGSSDACNVAADVTIAILQGSPNSGYTGQFTVNNTKTLTITDSLEQHDIAITGTGAIIVGGAAEFRGALTGAGSWTVAGEVRNALGADWSAFTGTLTWNGTNPDTISFAAGASHAFGNFIVDGTSTLTMEDDTAFQGFTLTGGTFDDGGFALSFGADGLLYNGGTNDGTGTWTQTASGDVSWDTNAEAVDDLVLGGAGVTSTLVGNAVCRRFTYGVGSGGIAVVLGASLLELRPTAGVNDFWTDGAGAFTDVGGGSIRWTLPAGDLTQGEFSIDGAKLDIRVGPGRTITATGAWSGDISKLFTVGCTGSGLGTVVMGANNLTCGALEMGRAAGAGFWGHLNLGSGTHSIASIDLAKFDDTTGNKVTVAGCDVQMSGSCDLSGIELVCATGGGISSFTVDGQFILDSTDSAACTMTLTGDLEVVGDVEVVENGTETTTIEGSGDWTIDGGLFLTGTITNTADGMWTMEGTHDLSWNSSGAAIQNLVIANGATVSLVGTTWVGDSLNVAGTLTGGSVLIISQASAGWWTQSGTVTATSIEILNVNTAPGGAIALTGGGLIRFDATSNKSITMDASLSTTGTLRIDGNGAGLKQTVDMAGNALAVNGTLTLGDDNSTGSGILLLGNGTHHIGSLVDGNAANDANAFAFERSLVYLSGAMDGDNIAFTNTVGVVIGGDIDNVDLTGQTPILHIYPNSGGGGNTNVTELAGIPQGETSISVGVAV